MRNCCGELMVRGCCWEAVSKKLLVQSCFEELWEADGEELL